MRGTPSCASNSLGEYPPNIGGRRAQSRVQRRRKVRKRRKHVRVGVRVVSCGLLFDCTFLCTREGGRGRQPWSPRCAAALEHSTRNSAHLHTIVLLQPYRHESLRSPTHLPRTTHSTLHTTTPPHRIAHSPDLTRYLEITVSTTFHPKSAFTTGKSLAEQPARLLSSTTIVRSAPFADAIVPPAGSGADRQHIEDRKEAATAAAAVGPDGACYSMRGGDGWHATEELATASTVPKVTRRNHGFIFVGLGIAAFVAEVGVNDYVLAPEKKDQ